MRIRAAEKILGSGRVKGKSKKETTFAQSRKGKIREERDGSNSAHIKKTCNSIGKKGSRKKISKKTQKKARCL